MQPKIVSVKGYERTCIKSHLKSRHGEETVKKYKTYMDSKTKVKTLPNRVTGDSSVFQCVAIAISCDKVRLAISRTQVCSIRHCEIYYSFYGSIKKIIFLFTNLNISEQDVTVMRQHCQINFLFEGYCSQMKTFTGNWFVCTTTDMMVI